MLLDGSESRPYHTVRDEERAHLSRGRGSAVAGRLGESSLPDAEGFANKQIAGELGISIKTFEKHRQQVMNKLGIHDVAGLTRHAVFTGMVGGDVRQDLLSANLPATPVGVEAGPPEQHPEI